MQFAALSANQMEQACAMFYDARPGDGYLYEVTASGCILSRRKSQI